MIIFRTYHDNHSRDEKNLVEIDVTSFEHEPKDESDTMYLFCRVISYLAKNTNAEKQFMSTAELLQLLNSVGDKEVSKEQIVSAMDNGFKYGITVVQTTDEDTMYMLSWISDTIMV